MRWLLAGALCLLTLVANASPNQKVVLFGAARPVFIAGLANQGSTGTSATSQTVTAGAAIPPGALMIAAFSMAGASSPPASFVPASGWTQLDATTITGNSALAIFYKVAGPGETGSYAFSWANATSASAGNWGFVAYANVSASNPIDASLGQTNGTTTSYTAPSIPASGALKSNADIYVGIFGNNGASGAVTPPVGTTLRLNGSSAGGSLTIIDKSLTSNAATGAFVVTGTSHASRGYSTALLP